MAKKYKCPYCEERLIRKDLIDHIDKEHEELIPDESESAQVVYDVVNGTNGAGRCRVCGSPTKWNSSAKRYDVLCGNPKCKQKMREDYKKNMLKVHGTYNILNDDEQQKKMLANRSISGTYKFTTDGGFVTYTGSYEKKFLEFADKVMQIPSKDIMAPGPTLEYEMNGEKHFYITDFLYIPYNLIIEVKDGGNNPNSKDSPGMRSSRQRTVEKERLITDRGEYNYLRLTDNQFVQLLEIFMEIKKALLEGDDSKVVRIHESYISESTRIFQSGWFDEYKKYGERRLKEIQDEKESYISEGVFSQLVMSAPVKAYNAKNKTPINWLPDLIKYHKNPGLENYVNKCKNPADLRYIKSDTYTTIKPIEKIKERISLCKKLGDCSKTSSYYKFIKKNYIDAGLTEKDCDATINWVKSFCKSINDKIDKLHGFKESYISEARGIDNKSNINHVIDIATGKSLGGNKRKKLVYDNLTKFTAYHLEPKVKAKNKKYLGGWDEELYSKDIPSAINNDIKYNYECKNYDKVSAYVYTAGADLKAIYLGTITIFDKNNPNDWEWEEQETLDKKTYDYLMNHPMVEATDISNFYEEYYE